MTSPTVMVRQEDEHQSASTPTVRRAVRRAMTWVAGLAVVVLGALLVIALVRGGVQAGIPYAADNPAPEGAMALAEVLRDQGVEVIPTGSLADTQDAAEAAGGPVTVLLWDADLLLDDIQHRRLLLLTDDLVVLEPALFELEDLTPGIAMAGGLDGTFDADCDVDAVRKAGSVSGSGSAYRITGDDVDATGCLADDDRYGLVQVERSGTTITLVGLATAFSNGEITEEGDAALALNLLGANRTLIWYLPTAADLGGRPAPSIADLTPPWVTPLAVTFVLIAAGAILWRSRRVGPLVVENLPVVVRASETMEGRARLYDRANARLHALDALRIGAVARLARTCGLPRTATVTEVVDAVAAVTGRDRAAVAGILIDRVPAGDAELVALSDDLLRLETDTTAGARPATEWTS
ncbi:MAG TPA: DUF4350 domain-containing protein [Pseudolysinimonas sp.]|nr:DUF4350 domain-containing protein [Pseudolysinimonas sp.]